MKKRMGTIFLGSGVALLLCALLGMLQVHHTGNGAFQWLLVPSFLLVGISGERKVWRKTDAESLPDSIWFAPNS